MSDKPRSIRATRIGGHAYRYLMAGPRIGRVVSSFSGGINLLFEDREAFVPLQTPTVPLHPWAIEIPGRAFQFAEGTPVTAEELRLTVGGTRIMVSNARVEELSLPRFSAQSAAIVRSNLPILAHFVEEAKKTRAPDPFQPQIDAILALWRESNDPTVLVGLIGLGAGSTPTGDDVLVGIIAGMSIFEHVDDPVKETLAQLRAGIQETARARTPLPSSQMLLAACDSCFPELLLALLNSLTSKGAAENDLLERAEIIAQLGHHSGPAILLGLKA